MADPFSVWQGEFRLFGVALHCHVLDDGTRIIEAPDMEALLEAMGNGATVDEDEMAAFARWQRGVAQEQPEPPAPAAVAPPRPDVAPGPLQADEKNGDESWWCDCRDRKGPHVHMPNWDGDRRYGMILTALVDVETGEEIPGSRK